MQYVHTNLIAKDADALIAFYKAVLGCESIGHQRDLQGEWLDRLTGITHAHLTGEHLALPGYEGHGPTLEIFHYDQSPEAAPSGINSCGFSHIAFLVDDVRQTLQQVLAAGGGQVGELVETVYPDGKKATFVYATDPEGNIVELQSWN